MGKRVLVAMSGGVDSSVTAALLLEQGYELQGVTLTMVAAAEGACGANQGAIDARAVADKLGFPHVTIDASKVFGREVLENFIGEYRLGRTPNPCVRCNRYVKFGFLMNTARELGCEMIATGHYALLWNGELHRGIDRQKDQSYFLYRLYSVEIERIMFPLGELTKPQVRERANALGLPNAARTESQDICFIPDGDYAGFLARNGMVAQCGPIVDLRGNVIGRHTGIQNYTVGQRKGLGALGQRMFVKELRPSENLVVAAQDHELLTTTVTVHDAVYSNGGIVADRDYAAQIRYRSTATSCRIAGITPDSFTITFEEPVRAAAPGQSAVVYDGDRVVAGGTLAPTPLSHRTS